MSSVNFVCMPDLLAGLALLIASGGCSNSSPSGTGVADEDLQMVASTLESLRPFDAEEGDMGAISVGEAYEIAVKALEMQGRPASIWETPTFIVHNNYFFTEKYKFQYQFSGVLVSAESGDAAIVNGTLKVRDLVEY